MKLIKNLGTRLDKTGRKQSWGKFKCLICLQEVERRLSSGKVKSCGCISKNFKHGGKGTDLYQTWANIKTRCFNPNSASYKYYGGRGITICDEWLEFIPFRDWSLNNGYADNLVIDRKNPDGNYEPTNCRWITILESNRNKTNTITLEIANEIRKLDKIGDYKQKELAEKFNIHIMTVSKIINNKSWVNKI